MMTAAVKFLRCGWAKKMKFISAHNGQWTPVLLVPALKGISRAPLRVCLNRIEIENQNDSKQGADWSLFQNMFPFVF